MGGVNSRQLGKQTRVELGLVSSRQAIPEVKEVNSRQLGRQTRVELGLQVQKVRSEQSKLGRSKSEVSKMVANHSL